MELVIGGKAAVGVDQLIDATKALEGIGTLYVGYPILSTADESVTLDAILTTPDHGVTVFDVQSVTSRKAADRGFWERLDDQQGRIVTGFQAKLLRHPALTRQRTLKVPITVVTFVPDQDIAKPPADLEIELASPDTLEDVLERLPEMDRQFYPALNAAIQNVSTIRPRKRRESVSPTSKGGKIREIERQIANLDSWQKKGAIETPEGPQRIRGLAGSGKTVVLALKAAYLHAVHPEWNIVVTFNTRSLYGQFRDLIRRFSFEHINDEPDWNRLQVMHGWGTAREPGCCLARSFLTGSSR